MSERILIYQMHVLGLYTKENIPEIISQAVYKKKKNANCDYFSISHTVNSNIIIICLLN